MGKKDKKEFPRMMYISDENDIDECSVPANIIEITPMGFAIEQDSDGILYVWKYHKEIEEIEN